MEVSKLWEATITKTGLGELGGFTWRPWPKRPWQGLKAGLSLAERLRDIVISARQITDWCGVPACLFSVRGWLVNFSAGS